MAVGVALLGLNLTSAGQFRSGVSLVELYVSVLGRDDRPVEALAREDFVVLEDGVAQDVSVFAAGNVPLSLAVGLDRSFSVAGARLAQMKAAAARLIDSLHRDDRLLLLAIGSRVDVLAPLGTDRTAQSRALAAVDPFGSTSLHDAIVAAVDRIQDAPGRRALVLLSDGVDRYSRASASDVLALAKARDVLIFPVAVGSPAPSLFVQLSAATGGRAFTVRDPTRLDDALRDLTRELRAQYLIGYVPARDVSARREWRTIRVDVKRQGVTARTRQGYWTR
jgi:Ca-activated chloride channel family protein